MKKQFTFENFLTGEMANDYVLSSTPYPLQIQQAAKKLREAEYVLLGAGAGMSTAAGSIYGGEWFRTHFADFRKKYGEENPYMQDMYSAGFYPYPDEEAYWGYWCREALLAGVDADFTPLHRELLEMLAGKDLFCLSTNADAQFTKAGLPEEKIFCTQGDYFHIQCARACHQQAYNAAKRFHEMDRAQEDCRIPSDMVPKCPVCGGRMVMNLRADGYFVQDADWYIAEGRFSDYLNRALQSGKKVCLLELGVGFNTPAIIRFPFEKLVRNNEQVSLVRLNMSEAYIPQSLSARVTGINADIKTSLHDIAAELKKAE